MSEKSPSWVTLSVLKGNHGFREGYSCHHLAHTNQRVGASKVFVVCEFLQMLYSRLQLNSGSTDSPPEEGSSLKQAFSTAPVWKHPDALKPFMVIVLFFILF